MKKSDTLKQYLKNCHKGKENAITSKDIEKELGYDGIIIRQNVNQLQRTIEQLEHRLDGIINALKGLKTNLI